MYNVREVTKDLYWVGANDHRPAASPTTPIF